MCDDYLYITGTFDIITVCKQMIIDKTRCYFYEALKIGSIILKLIKF